MSIKKKARCYDNLHTFIYQLLKHHNKDSNMTEECKDLINHLIRDLAVRYIIACVALCRYSKKVTIDSNAVIAITKIWVDDPKPLLEFAHDTWDTYSQNTIKGISKNRRAGLYLPPARFKTLFKEYRGADQKIGEPAYIFLTAIIEFVVSTILTKAIELATNDNRITISGVYIFQAINTPSTPDTSHRSVRAGNESRYTTGSQIINQLYPNSFMAGFGWIGNERLFSSQQEYLSRKEESDSDSDSDSELE